MAPSLSAARRQAKVTASIQQLRQIHLVAKMYQVDEGLDGNYGTASQMGLPDAMRVDLATRTPAKLWTSPCGPHRSLVQPGVTDPGYYTWNPNDAQTSGKVRSGWNPDILVWRENMVLAFDEHCTPPSTAVWNFYESRRFLGVLLSGRAVVRDKPGDHRNASWWSEPESP